MVLHLQTWPECMLFFHKISLVQIWCRHSIKHSAQTKLGFKNSREQESVEHIRMNLKVYTYIPNTVTVYKFLKSRQGWQHFDIFIYCHAVIDLKKKKKLPHLIDFQQSD